MHRLNRIIYTAAIGMIIFLGSVDASSVTYGLRLRRATPKVDISLKTPVINALTERTAIDASWEQCMIVAPMTIQLLGELLIVSSVKDVSFRAFSPDRQFIYIRNPNSFRATLLQISFAGYHAFLSGHSTMNTIQLRMIQIPKHIKTALKLLAANYPRRMLNRLLPQVLNNIEETGKECVTITNATSNQFSQVMLLVNEVIETTTETQSEHESKVEENERELEVLREQKANLEKEKEFRAKLYQEATDIANKAESAYQQALNDIPTGLSAFLRDFARGLLKIADTVASVAAATLTGSMMQGGTTFPQLASSTFSSGNIGGKKPISFSLSNTLNMAEQFSKTIRSFQIAVSNKTKDPKAMTGFNIAFRAFREFVTSLHDNPAKAIAMRLTGKAEKLAAKAAEAAKKIKSNNETGQEIITEIEQICDDLDSLQSANQQANPETASRTISTVGSHDTPSADDSSQNEVRKAQIAQTHLTEMRRRQDEQAAEYLKLLEVMRQMSAKMMTINLATINYNEIIAMLRKALELLSKVHQQWDNFVRFFNQMSVLIKDMIKGPLKRFLQVAGAGTDVEHAMRLQLIDTLKEETYGIHRESYILFVMSRTYYEVSSKYLMGRLAGLSSMLTARNESERRELMETLKNQTDVALEEIEALIIERKAAFDTELNKRNTELTALIDELGGPSEKTQLAIEEGKRLIDSGAAWDDDS
ncbi:unnamed protein product [Adineta ricciae]|uniref:Uncharacterized protein n=1 Tax=Adineta ricciae TaxID=249248 RepID=A0A813XMB9_ADIRI|nr:unnamed protein product [Adineta ricciae]CAF1317540.1 unnamed protein product [Adineta ricciae]